MSFTSRTKEAIFQQLLTLKNADAILSLILTSNSKASFYQSLFVLYADITGDFELTFEAFESEMDYLLETKQVHTANWWKRNALAFQLGDSLSENSAGNLYYAVEDATKQIVKRAAVQLQDEGGIILKVAKLGTDLITPEKLSTVEKSAFDSYIDDTQPAGIVPQVISVDGDELRISATIIIDNQIINPSNGTLLSDGVTKPVENAIMEYLSIFQNNGFGGTFYANGLLAKILSTTGVVNAYFTQLDKKSTIDIAWINVLSLTGSKFSAYSGYVLKETAWILSDHLTYTTE
jgi:hypothetical protein